MTKKKRNSSRQAVANWRTLKQLQSGQSEPNRATYITLTRKLREMK